MAITLSKTGLSKSIRTNNEGSTLTGDVITFTEPPRSKAFAFVPQLVPPSDANAQREGSMYYDSDDQTHYYYDGSTWLPLIQPVDGTPLFTPSIDNRLVRFNGTGGSIQDSLVTLDDTGNMLGIANLTATGISATNIGTQNLTCTTSLSTPSINSLSGVINFNNVNLTNLGALTATTGTYSTGVSTPLLTTAGAGISFDGKNITNVSAITAQGGNFTNYIDSAGPVTIDFAPLTDEALTIKQTALNDNYCQLGAEYLNFYDVLTNSNGGIGMIDDPKVPGQKMLGLLTGLTFTFSNKNVYGINKLTALTTLCDIVDSASGGSNIGFSSRNLTDIGRLNCNTSLQSLVTSPTGTDLTIQAPGVQTINLESATNANSIRTNALTARLVNQDVLFLQPSAGFFLNLQRARVSRNLTSSSYYLPTHLLFNSTTGGGSVSPSGTPAEYVYSMTANTLDANCSSLRWIVCGNTANNANAKQIAFNFGSVVLANVTLSTNTDGWYKAEIIVARGSSATLMSYYGRLEHLTSGGTLAITPIGGTNVSISPGFTSTLDLSITTTAGTNHIFYRHMTVEKI